MATDEAIRQREVFPRFEGFHTLKSFIELARVEKLFNVSEFPGILFLLWWHGESFCSLTQNPGGGT